MKLALLNPNWTFEGSIYFGCRDAHLPLEYGYAKALLEAAGHEALIVDGQLDGLTTAQMRGRLEAFQPDVTVITTAPSYLFWRCAPPELRVPQELVRDLADVAGCWVAVGPHGSTTPTTTLRKLGVPALILGECEEVLVKLADTPPAEWGSLSSVATWRDGAPVVNGGPAIVDMAKLPALRWPDAAIRRHDHHHHRFDAGPLGPGGELEASRGCPYRCSFCAKDNFRDGYRKRPLAVVLEELDAMIAQGVEYVYFVDEIFLPDKPLLEALADREVKFGIQTRIDLFSYEVIELLGKAGCVSIEAGVESISVEGRKLLEKNCRLSTEEIAGRLIHAKKFVPFVQANLLDSKVDDPEAIEAWRQHLLAEGVWANEPVPLFPYPGSPQYRKQWGMPDEQAWERALDYYLGLFEKFSDIQEERPKRLHELELSPATHV